MSTTPEVLKQIQDKLPQDWATMSPEHKLHFLLKAADEVLKMGGKWILVDGTMTLLQLLELEK